MTAEQPYLNNDSKMCQIGSIYNLLGRRVHRGKRSSSLDGDRIIDNNPERISKIKIIKILIKCIYKKRFYLNAYYAGPWFSQFGHFLVETLSRISGLRKNTKFPFLFHTMDMDPNYQHPFEWQLKFLSYLDVSKVAILSNQNMFVLNLKILDEQVVFPRIVKSSALSAYNQIKLRNKVVNTNDNLIFFSRAKLDPFHLRLDVELNEEIEKLFLKYDFTILHPEQLTIEDQIKYSSQAKILAGVRGSALHLSLFSNSKITVMEIGDSHQTHPNPLQISICRTKLQNLIFFQFNHEKKIHDLKNIEQVLVNTLLA